MKGRAKKQRTRRTRVVKARDKLEAAIFIGGCRFRIRRVADLDFYLQHGTVLEALGSVDEGLNDWPDDVRQGSRH